MIDVLGIVFICLAVVVLFNRTIPYCMDEFIFLRLHSISWLRLWNTGLSVPFRVWGYIGAFQAIFYWPLEVLWRNPMSARFFAGIMLGIQAWAIGKLFRIRPLMVFLGLCVFFPYFFQHFVDTGPVHYETTSIFLLLLTLRAWAEKGSIRYPIIAALLVFFGIYDKLTYFWVLPGIALLFLIAMIERRNLSSWKTVRRVGAQGLVAATLLGILLALLLFTPIGHHGQDYWNEVRHGHLRSLSQIIMDGLHRKIVNAFINPLTATQRIYVPNPPEIRTWIYDAFLYLSAPAGMLWYAIRRRHSWKKLLLPAGTYAAFLGTAYVIISTKNAWAMHHAVLAFPFLILSILGIGSLIAQSLHGKHRRTFLLSVSIAYVLLNAYYFTVFYLQTERVKTFTPSPQLMSFVDTFSSGPFKFVDADWGVSFIEQVYATHPEAVLYHHRAGIFLYNKWKSMEKHKQGEVVVLYNSYLHPDSWFGEYAAQHNYARCEVIDSSEQWQALVHPDGALGSYCFPKNTRLSSELSKT